MNDHDEAAFTVQTGVRVKTLSLKGQPVVVAAVV